MTAILIVEDEPHIASFVCRGLAAAGFSPTIASDGRSGLEAALSGDHALVLLDVGLPGMDGMEVLRTVRATGSRIPIIMLTARTSTADTVDGLESGANDYIRKPFTFDELLARVRTALRDSPGGSGVTITHDEVTLDILGRRATVDGREVDLSAREFALAEQFLRNPGQVLTREALLSRVWGMDFDPGSNVVDVYVRYLRGKLGVHHITTVRGTGYRWE
ncbi:response regulator transcription factor [Microbacterium lacus]|uniref:response regulator transcription factor n=1 Tax=Microbacterium lacus TaxID=415217 RepID=UPI00384F11FC